MPKPSLPYDPIPAQVSLSIDQNISIMASDYLEVSSVDKLIESQVFGKNQPSFGQENLLLKDTVTFADQGAVSNVSISSSNTEMLDASNVEKFSSGPASDSVSQASLNTSGGTVSQQGGFGVGSQSTKPEVKFSF